VGLAMQILNQEQETARWKVPLVGMVGVINDQQRGTFVQDARNVYAMLERAKKQLEANARSWRPK